MKFIRLFKGELEASDPSVWNEEFSSLVRSFWNEWNSTNPNIISQTSGSTGTPKKTTLSKKKMIQSALRSNAALGLTPKSSALLPMSLAYIGAMMMMVRADLGAYPLYITPPSSHPFESFSEQVTFLTAVPLQLLASLTNPQERDKINQLQTILLGGSPIPLSLEKEIQMLSPQVYASYGMTETLSHIALRAVNGANKSDYYTPLEGVSITLTPQGTLSISDQIASSQTNIETTDCAEIQNDGTFKITGRIDNVINSGGRKIHPEILEQTLSSKLPPHYSFAFTATTDPLLGEALVFVYTGKDTAPKSNTFTELHPYDRPKYVCCIPEIPTLYNGKIDRILLRKTIERLSKNTLLPYHSPHS